MSLMYKIEVKENVKIHVDVQDEILHQIRLQQILSKDEMIDIFVEELEKQGFELVHQEPSKNPDNNTSESTRVWIRHDEVLGEIQVFDPQKMELSASIKQSRDEEAEIVQQGQGDLDFNTKSQIRKQASLLIEENRKQMEMDLEEQLQGEITQKLQENTVKRNAQIQDALQKTYGKALKKRAKSIGQVVSQQENESDGIYELKITIEL